MLRRVLWRILPLLLLLYFIAYLDRINISFAATSMQRDLHFSDTLYGTGAGLFFLGALLAGVPSNLLLARVGARRTIAGPQDGIEPLPALKGDLYRMRPIAVFLDDDGTPFYDGAKKHIFV